APAEAGAYRKEPSCAKAPRCDSTIHAQSLEAAASDNSDVHCGQRMAFKGMFIPQKRHSFVAGAAAAGAGRRNRLTCLTSRNTANATMMKLTIVLMKFPYAITGTPAFLASSRLL